MVLPAQWNKTLPPEVILAAHGEIPGPPMSVPSASQGYSAVTDVSPMATHTQEQDPTQLVSNTGELPYISAIRNSPQSHVRDLFWSPFPDQSVPLQANHTGGPMEISAMLDVPNDWNQLNRDGFRPNAILDDPVFDPQNYSQPNRPWNQG